MSRKDYQLIANIVKIHSGGQRVALANAFAIQLTLDNPRFDRSRFLRACGL